MKKLSLCMIVKNEEGCLKDCLEKAALCCDEIVIVDTGSTDKTKKVAAKFTDKIYDFKWVDDFSEARNFSFSKASSDYIMWLDADDILPDQTVLAVLKWKEDVSNPDCLLCPYATAFDENFRPLFQFNRERIVRNLHKPLWKDPVHEVIVPFGKIENNNEIIVFHNKKKKSYSDRNLNIYKRYIADGNKLSPRQQFYYARELYFHGFYDEAVHQFSLFLTEGKGWKENNIEACLNLSKCYQQIEKTDQALTSLFGSFVYGRPRGEIMCEIGDIFQNKKDYATAIYWYSQALSVKPDLQSGGFVNLDCYQFYPALQLCVCYYKIGDVALSKHFHEVSKGFKPEDRCVLENEKFFKELQQNQ